MVKISKKYIPKETEKYMCAKHLAYFKQKLMDWKKDLKRTNNEAIFNEPIGLKRLMARPVATLCISAQEKHEKEEKVYADI